MDGLEQLTDIMRQGLIAFGIDPDYRGPGLKPLTRPAEPITKPTPAPTTTPQPSKDDPFNVPAPKINPTPKG